MHLAELLPIAGALCAPAFFLLFALAALGAPLLALVLLLAAQMRSTRHHETFARRLLRMALSCAVPALLAFAVVVGLAGVRAPWLQDWFLAAPMGPGIFILALLTYCASLLTLRLSHAAQSHHRQSSPLAAAFVLTLLAGAIFWLGMALLHNLQEQAQAVLRAPMEGGIGVAPLISLDASTLPPLAWAGLTALIALSLAAAGAVSLEYLLALREREPFGRDTLAQMLRLGARSTLRAALLSGAFLPVLWNRLPEMPALPGGEEAARLLIALAGAACLLLCFCAGLVAKSNRPWERSLTIHASLLLLWLGLTALLSVALLCFYAV